jgi:hypothetical protein
MIYKSYADLFHQQVNMVLQDSCNLDHNRGIVKRSVTPSGERLVLAHPHGYALSTNGRLEA